jgi:hypothetical protein
MANNHTPPATCAAGRTHLKEEAGGRDPVERQHAVVRVAPAGERDGHAEIPGAIVGRANVVDRVGFEHHVMQLLGHVERREREGMMARVRVQEHRVQRLPHELGVDIVAQAETEHIAVEPLGLVAIAHVDEHVAHPHAACLEPGGDLFRAERVRPHPGPMVNLRPDAVRILEDNHFPHAACRGLGGGAHPKWHARAREPVLHCIEGGAVGGFPADIGHVVCRSVMQQDAVIVVVHAQRQRAVGPGRADGKSR